MEILRCEALSKVYRSGESKVIALDQVSLSLAQGSFTAITGPSGSGKSTLLHMLGALDAPTRGMVYFEGRPLGGMSPAEAAVFRNRRNGRKFRSGSGSRKPYFRTA